MLSRVPRLQKSVFSVASLLLALGAAPTVASAETITYGPFVSRGYRPDSMIVRWGTAGNSDPGVVGFRKKGAAMFTTASGSAARDHEVVLSGLTVGGAYEYQVTSGTVTSATFGFQTCPAPGMPMDVVFYGDSRSVPSAHARVVAQVAKHNPEMIFESGDIAPAGIYTQYLSEFFPVVRDVIASTPFMAAPGNHDAGVPFAGNYGSIFPSPRPSGAAWQPYYSFVCGNAMFVALNSNDVLDSTQQDWLTSQLHAAASDSALDHVLVWFHHSAYSPGQHGDDASVISHWVPLFNDPVNKVTAVFSGHDHIYARMKDTSSVLYLVSGGAGADLYTDTKASRATKVVSKSAYNFVALHIAGAGASGVAYDDTGSELDRFSVTKPHIDPPDFGGGGGGSDGGGGGRDGGGGGRDAGRDGGGDDPLPGGGCELSGFSGGSGMAACGLAGLALVLGRRRRRRRA
jgi:3',5'-cyclic AMP phosphodiesterase CpdA